MDSDDWGFPDPMKRTYKGLDIYVEHAFDGKWEARVDYTFSKGQGNMEGQVKSEFGQANISKTQDWDAAEIMTFANGYLANDRRHQLKARGSYQISDEWLIGANIRIQSGGPISCLASSTRATSTRTRRCRPDRLRRQLPHLLRQGGYAGCDPHSRGSRPIDVGCSTPRTSSTRS
jgi:hypothetical protein